METYTFTGWILFHLNYTENEQQRESAVQYLTAEVLGSIWTGLSKEASEWEFFYFAIKQFPKVMKAISIIASSKYNKKFIQIYFFHLLSLAFSCLCYIPSGPNFLLTTQQDWTTPRYWKAYSLGKLKNLLFLMEHSTRLSSFHVLLLSDSRLYFLLPNSKRWSTWFLLLCSFIQNAHMVTKLWPIR